VGVVLLSLLSSACTNRTFNALLPLNRNPAGDTSGSGTNSISSDFALRQVIRTQSNPTVSFDLVGDGSGKFGALCGLDGLQPGDPTPCRCKFLFLDGTIVRDDPSDTTLVEADLVRCNYSSIIPAQVQQVEVSLVSPGVESNSRLFSFSASVPTAVLTDETNFAQVKRFQCRSHVFVPHPGESGGDPVYDPAQSESERLSYGFNFFTTNPGRAIAEFAALPAANQRFWECPLDLLSSSTLGLDPTLFSRNGQTTDALRRIYPPAGSGQNRADFWVAKTKIGPFTQPINLPYAPGVPNALPDNMGQTPTGTAPVIGFGVPAGTSETCPGPNIAIPPGFSWRKLWLFRKALPVRQAVISPRVSNTAVLCSPGTWEDQSPNVPPVNANDFRPLFPDCGFTPPASAPSGTTGRGCTLNQCATYEDFDPISRLFRGSPVTDRILLAGQNTDLARCVRMGELNATNASLMAGRTTRITAPPVSFPEIDPALEQALGWDTRDVPFGTDVWSPRETDNSNDCAEPENTRFDPLNLCRQPSLRTVVTPSPRPTPGYFPHASFSELTTTDIDVCTGGGSSAPGQACTSSRVDWTVVVTPTSITKAQLESSSAEVRDYLPNRIIPASACPNGNPQTCDPKTILEYELHIPDLADTAVNGGTPSIVYPICVLQKD
jgi:hypothetical protein